MKLPDSLPVHLLIKTKLYVCLEDTWKNLPIDIRAELWDIRPPPRGRSSYWNWEPTGNLLKDSTIHSFVFATVQEQNTRG